MKDFEDLNKSKNVVKKLNSNLSKDEIISEAFKLHSKGNIPEAVKYYQYFLAKGYQDHRVFWNYGVILKNLSKIKEAEKFVKKTIEIKPDFFTAYVLLGIIMRDLNRLEDAEEFTRKAIEIEPSHSNAYANLGLILKDLGKLDEAKEFTLKAIELQPDFSNAYYNLILILIDLGKLEEAEDFANKLINIDPLYFDAYYIRGWCNFKLGVISKNPDKFKAAEEFVLKAIEIKQDSAKTNYLLCQIQSSLGKYSEALEEIKKLIQNDSQNHLYQAELSRLKFILSEQNIEKKSQ